MNNIIDQDSGSLQKEKKYSLRFYSRYLVVQLVYQYLMTQCELSFLKEGLSEAPEYQNCDRAYSKRLVDGIWADFNACVSKLEPLLDRPITMVSFVERSILIVGVFEMSSCRDVPHRVVINEAIELAKYMGGADSHRYINGVLDRFRLSLASAS